MLKNSPTVDIILPNYQKKPYITDCLNSLLDQSYSSWRCIVVDNFSEDGSWEIIQDFAKQDNRFELYQIPKPTTSFYQTWNFGLTKVENSYFCVLTSDDVWDKRWLEIAIETLENNPDAVCSAARTRLLDAKSNWLDISVLNVMGEEFFKTGDNFQLRKGLLSSVANYFMGPIYTSIHSLVMRSDILNKGEKFAEDLRSIADYEWYIRVGLYGDIIYHPNIEVGWRVYEGQASNPKNQFENGKLMLKIHLRNKYLISQQLGITGKFFEQIADEYDRTILAYHYQRPFLANFKSNLLEESIRLIHIILRMPKSLLIDIFLKIRGKNFYSEESLKVANKIAEIIQEKSN